MPGITQNLIYKNNKGDNQGLRQASLAEMI